MDFSVVLVSPMRRTLQTAYCIFKEHPNFASIKFIVAPHARESLLAAAAISLDLDEKLKAFSPLFPQGLDTTFVNSTL